jgi:hypothetical protein
MGTLQLQDPGARATFEEIRDYSSNALRYMSEHRRIEQPSSGEQSQQSEQSDEDEIGSSSRSSRRRI